MHRTHAATTTGLPGPSRVRDQAREVLAVMGFSAATSGALALALLVLTTLGK